MNLVGFFSDEEFECLSKMFTNVDADDFMSQLHGDMFSSSHADENLFNAVEISPPSHFPRSNEAILNSNKNVALNLFPNFEKNDYSYISHQESSNSSGSDHQVMHFQDHDVTFLLATIDNNNNISDELVDFYVTDNINDDHIGTTLPAFSDDAGKINTMICDDVDGKGKNIKRSSEEAMLKEKPKKKARVPRDAQKNKKHGGQTKKNKKIILEDDKNNISSNTDNDYKTGSNNGGQEMLRSPSSTMSSEEDSIISAYPDESNIGGQTRNDSLASNSKGKTRASRGNATDPQSLYARKRRERINQRLKKLQNLIPNGTKVDISTMLEEAVHYVNFLQLQIKLLSSDDMWMYAPLAYNGIDVGVCQKLFPNL